MRIIGLIPAILASLLLYPADNASNMFASFVDAFNRGDTENVKAACAAGYWTNTYNSPQKLIRQGYGKGRLLLFEIKTIVQSNDRAAADIIVLRASDRRPSDMIFVYAEKRTAAWLVYNFNEDTRFKELFLAGLVRSDLDPRTLPPNRELDALGRRLALRFPEMRAETSIADLTNVISGICTLADGASGRIHLNLFQYVKRPAVFETKWSSELNRGALIVSGAVTKDDPYPDAVVLYFAGTAQGFAIYNTSGMLSLSGLVDW
ncbi:MAG: hypothetical protein AABZ39_10165 [Spirochaetota bacterium]